MRLLIITTDPKTKTWSSLDAKLTAIANALNNTPNVTWEVTIEYQDLTPEVIDGYITHEWFDTISRPLLAKGYQHIYIHFSMKRWSQLKLKAKLRGFNQADSDVIGECYGRGDENTMRGATRKNQFIQNILHEMSHELHRATGVEDKTHEYHFKHHDISGIFASIDMAKWQPRYQEQMKRLSWLQEQLAKLFNINQNKMIHPLRLPFRDTVSQKYGIANSIYKKTGVHLGTDYPCPVGTPLSAPADGEIVFTGTSKERGNYIQYKHGDYILEIRHLSKMMPLGKYRLGDVIAYSGNTGSLTTGPHVCMVVWIKEDGLSKINKENWKVLTTDAHKLYI